MIGYYIEYGTNDLCDEVSAEIIFKQGLEPMYEISP
jgi:hypothetical protein